MSSSVASELSFVLFLATLVLLYQWYDIYQRRVLTALHRESLRRVAEESQKLLREMEETSKTVRENYSKEVEKAIKEDVKIFRRALFINRFNIRDYL